jgi:hypothetical protein
MEVYGAPGPRLFDAQSKARQLEWQEQNGSDGLGCARLERKELQTIIRLIRGHPLHFRVTSETRLESDDSDLDVMCFGFFVSPIRRADLPRSLNSRLDLRDCP